MSAFESVNVIWPEVVVAVPPTPPEIAAAMPVPVTVLPPTVPAATVWVIWMSLPSAAVKVMLPALTEAVTPVVWEFRFTWVATAAAVSGLATATLPVPE